VTSRRSLARHLTTLAARLGDRDAEVADGTRLEESISAIERAADEAALHVDRSASAAERLAQALDALHQGVVLCDEEGRVVYRNLLAESFAGARHAEALPSRPSTSC
jgi:Transcriptional regulator containing PAS, AAA-type ATPase, and DNA-binding domains